MSHQFRWTYIDASNVGDHHHITLEDKCIFLGDYNVGDGFHNRTPNALNQEIYNLKILPNDTSRKYYRGKAIKWFSANLRALSLDFLKSHTWVPIPSSKIQGDAEYNPKMLDILIDLKQGCDVDVRELVIQTQSTRKSSQSHGDRLSLQELLDVYELVEAHTTPVPQSIILLDDVLTAGTHFRAMHMLLSERFPNTPILGMFFARTIHQ